MGAQSELPFISTDDVQTLSELLKLRRLPVEGFSAGLVNDDDIYKWEVLVIGPPDTLYEGGFFKAILDFPKDYPQKPPKMKFLIRMVMFASLFCHDPGDDKWGYERPEERWLPVHTVETILLSVISMLADPNFESPANVDAAKMQRENYAEFKKRVAACVRKSQEE
ncbi:ubiquitin--protein ligase [Ancylostoma ceylanicum]|uniref:Ubiquitin--protein ligase n=1 Tax=Ancylostoma ceylanicum TaxID=53326 RepID=A0A0D6LEM9_9BILA|nr:ubiquitin--protein ligase [Ancylostoma ceylanicum]